MTNEEIKTGSQTTRSRNSIYDRNHEHTGSVGSITDRNSDKKSIGI
jgi:hypothetical protein